MLLVSRQWRWATLVVIIGVIFLARLGFWQLDRLEQRRLFNAEKAQQLAQPSFLLTSQGLPGEPADWRNRQVTVRGEYDFSQQVVLLAQNWQGRPGVHLVTPLRIEGSDQAVLVNRGWIPNREATVENLASFDEPGLAHVTGTIQTSQRLPRTAVQTEATAVVEPQREWYRVDIPAIQAQMPYELMPFYVLQEPALNGSSDLPYRIPTENDLSEGSHLSYALQWFAFALMLGVGYLVFVSKNGWI